MSEKETICWDCQNYSRCSWGRCGKPVNGWEATPTEYEDTIGEQPPIIIHSFMVESCPHFKHDKKVKVGLNELSAILGIASRTFSRTLKVSGERRIRSMLLKKGYKLYIVKNEDNLNTHREYYIEKI